MKKVHSIEKNKIKNRFENENSQKSAKNLLKKKKKFIF